MNKSLPALVIILITLTLRLSAQNLVQNPSLESYNLCPANTDQIDRADFWSSFGNTVDYYNACDSNSTQISGVGVPDNATGHQFAHSGVAYAGIITHDASSSTYREYLGTQLIAPLVIGQQYYISFYVSSSGQHGFRDVTNNMGAKFSTVAFSRNSPAPMNNFTHINHTQIISDTVNWTHVSGVYTPDSAYQYLIIGNFHSDASTSWIDQSGAALDYAYYYIDDICVSTDSLLCNSSVNIDNNEIIRQSFFPNPFSDKLNFISESGENSRLMLFTSTGEIIADETISGNHSLNTTEFAAGMYYYLLIHKDGSSERGKLAKISR